MCYALFNSLYESRLAFVESVKKECSNRGIDKDKIKEMDPIHVNDRFLHCLANKQSFQTYARDLVREAFLS